MQTGIETNIGKLGIIWNMFTNLCRQMLIQNMLFELGVYNVMYHLRYIPGGSLICSHNAYIVNVLTQY